MNFLFLTPGVAQFLTFISYQLLVISYQLVIGYGLSIPRHLPDNRSLLTAR
ncbi:hypothetical protein I8752_11215 [Nostocaceae cyanobacterium CENA369]|uniref:Uncharacterized protein n=1 Tax=Dendronalium phyllosphericum CENA369 TaxID=1725256 RepID=A0A8J7I3X8_9NOST|nr:hypothetical protein [Dendronalium phyllosphericum]MBH8573573.1 hypothetical protein [Dendronalium phyllosphericum CENA369]